MKNTTHPKLQITPIGGLGEIGHNMALYRTWDLTDREEPRERSFVVDVGILFPNNDCFSINYLTPDFKALKAYAPNLEDLVITHGHEDHIGAITHFLEVFPDITIHCSPFSKELMLSKFSYLGLATASLNFVEYQEGQSFVCQGFSITPFLIPHSIPETFGLFIKTPDKSIATYHLTDFKYHADTFDDAKNPLLKRLRASAQETLCKTRLLLLDSTNINSRGKTRQEYELIPHLEKIVRDHQGRVFATLFASNIERIQSFIDIAERTGRKIFITGKSFFKYIEIARKRGLLSNAPAVVIPETDPTPKHQNLIVLTSGCQGEIRGALARLAHNMHAEFKLLPTDLVLFSSKIIPGNEKKVYHIINKFYLHGCQVITNDDATIHTSGHPAQEDLKAVISYIDPTHLVPIHGEYSFLVKHAKFAKENFPHIEPLVLKNYDQLSFDSANHEAIISPLENPPAQSIYLEFGEEIEKVAINERKKVAHMGIIFVICKLDPIPKNVIAEISMMGVPKKVSDQKNDLQDHLHQELMSERKLWIGAPAARQEEFIKFHVRKYLKGIVKGIPHLRVHLIRN
jgi:ribonuclease J